MSLARFLEGDVISEAAFDAMILGAPNLTTANWAAENKPNLDQSEFDTITFAGIKYFIDEIRIATSFDEVIGGTVDPTLPDTIGQVCDSTWTRRDRGRLPFRNMLWICSAVNRRGAGIRSTGHNRGRPGNCGDRDQAGQTVRRGGRVRAR